MSAPSRREAPNGPPGTVILPAPTAWPIVLAFGVTLLVGGLVMNPSVSILGAILFLTACVGWFRDVLPQEKEERVEVRADVAVVSTPRREVERLPIAPE